jgi:hypothetical protein
MNIEYKKINKQSDIDKYKKQRNKVNNLKKTAKDSISGRGILASSKEEIKLKYLFSNSHFSSSS